MYVPHGSMRDYGEALAVKIALPGLDYRALDLLVWTVY